MQAGNDKAVEKKLDKNDYRDDELVSIRTKLNLPYYTNSAEFERVYGSVNIDGVVYDYVKRRVQNDTLELLCLPNTVKTGLQSTKNELAKSAADGQTSLPVKKAPSTLKISLPDFCQSIQTFTPLSLIVQKAYFLQNEICSFSYYNQRQERPPQAMDMFS